jgi:hypothetical protein
VEQKYYPVSLSDEFQVDAVLAVSRVLATAALQAVEQKNYQVYLSDQLQVDAALPELPAQLPLDLLDLHSQPGVLHRMIYYHIELQSGSHRKSFLLRSAVLRQVR